MLVLFVIVILLMMPSISTANKVRNYSEYLVYDYDYDYMYQDWTYNQDYSVYCNPN